MKKTYFKGDLAEYTGIKRMLYGGLFYEIKILEGRYKGHIKLTLRSPHIETKA